MLVPASQSEELVSLLKAAGDQATLILVQNAGHGLLQRGNGPITPSVKTVAADAVTFLTMHLSTSR
jgi:dipeptidyl aminopeptidase/acylaminoacyl peptidase